MATNTTNYNLVKPAQEDFYDIEVFNANMDVIDDKMKELADSVSKTADSSVATLADLKALYNEGKNVTVRYGSTIYSAISSSDNEMEFVAMGKNANGEMTESILKLTSAGDWTVSTTILVDKDAFDTHAHDGRYYAKSEVDTKFANKSNLSHTHDDRYYTESEVDAKLSGKSDTAHTHDDRYYTETEIDTKLSGKSDASHTHDDRYYTEFEVDAKLSNKADLSHSHDDKYYTIPAADEILASKSDTNHTHDDRYYTESETNNLLASKSDTNHTHDDRYYTESETNNLLNTKAAKSTPTTATLYASTWAGTEAPYSYTLSISGVTTTSVQEILPSTSITQAQLEALQAANIQDAGQTSGKIYLKAWGEKPTINIPIRIIKRGDI